MRNQSKRGSEPKTKGEEPEEAAEATKRRGDPHLMEKDMENSNNQKTNNASCTQNKISELAKYTDSQERERSTQMDSQTKHKLGTDKPQR